MKKIIQICFFSKLQIFVFFFRSPHIADTGIEDWGPFGLRLRQKTKAEIRSQVNFELRLILVKKHESREKYLMGPSRHHSKRSMFEFFFIRTNCDNKRQLRII